MSFEINFSIASISQPVLDNNDLERWLKIKLLITEMEAISGNLDLQAEHNSKWNVTMLLFAIATLLQGFSALLSFKSGIGNEIYLRKGFRKLDLS